jgi:hypothetical protein
MGHSRHSLILDPKHEKVQNWQQIVSTDYGERKGKLRRLSIALAIKL